MSQALTPLWPGEGFDAKKDPFLFLRDLRCCPLWSQVAKTGAATGNKSCVCSIWAPRLCCQHCARGTQQGALDATVDGLPPSFPGVNPEPQASQLTFSRPAPLAAVGALEIEVPVSTAGRRAAGRGAAGPWGEGRAIPDEALQAQRQKRPCRSFCRKQHSWHHGTAAREEAPWALSCGQAGALRPAPGIFHWGLPFG